jgi:hypothetical protein
MESIIEGSESEGEIIESSEDEQVLHDFIYNDKMKSSKPNDEENLSSFSSMLEKDGDFKPIIRKALATKQKPKTESKF